MLLYAKTTSISSFKYSLLIDIVKKLKQRSILAGDIFYNKLLKNFFYNKLLKILISKEINIFYLENETSETLINEIIKDSKNIKLISINKPKHLKPLNNYQFGHYLAGLIDGGGHFSSKQELIIVFHSLDASLAYYLKEQLGFGNVRKVKDKNAFLLIISSKDGLKKVLDLINKKIRSKSKFDQIINNILNSNYYIDLKKEIHFELNKDENLQNH
jgi:hypothetical protein